MQLLIATEYIFIATNIFYCYRIYFYCYRIYFYCYEYILLLLNIFYCYRIYFIAIEYILLLRNMFLLLPNIFLLLPNIFLLLTNIFLKNKIYAENISNTEVSQSDVIKRIIALKITYILRYIGLMYFICYTHRSGIVIAHYSRIKQKLCYNIRIQHNQTDLLSTLSKCHLKRLVFFANENKVGRGNILNFFENLPKMHWSCNLHWDSCLQSLTVGCIELVTTDSWTENPFSCLNIRTDGRNDVTGRSAGMQTPLKRSVSQINQTKD
jgi:hypothetical protein